NSKYCMANPGEMYLVYLSEGGATELDLSDAAGEFQLSWFNPRTGETTNSADKVSGGAKAKVNAPDKEDWLAVIKRG
ncbi:MAG: putative collagen-binding domain-containing protein, partial [Rubripirellula sp.]